MALGTDPLMSYEGIAQVAQVNPFHLTDRPTLVLCGLDLPCPNPTAKTMALPPAPTPVAHEPVQEIPAARAREPEAPVKRVIEVRFEFGRSALTREARAQLKDLLEGMSIAKIKEVSASGFTDAVGGQPINDRLAIKRAQAVRDQLVGAGISPDLIKVGGNGKCCYVQPNTTKAGRAANRRAEVIFLSITSRKE
jgi:outer membrane protein OmpA-like peptidoglycan-associated protein